MPDANTSDEPVLARLRSVLPPVDGAAAQAGIPMPRSDPAGPPAGGPVSSDGVLLAGRASSVAAVPSPSGPPWTRPIRMPAAGLPARPTVGPATGAGTGGRGAGVDGTGLGRAVDDTRTEVDGTEVDGTEVDDTDGTDGTDTRASGIGGRADGGGGPTASWSPSGGPMTPDGRLSGLGAFDPGRRGVKALAAVAAVVVLVAAVVAWRARPRTEPVSADSAVPTDTRVAGVGDARVAGVGDARAAGAGAAGADGVGAAGVGAAGVGAAGVGAVPEGVPASGAVPVVVAVGGKVRRPGLVRLPPGARVADALQAAGGADGGVDVALLNLARKVVDGELILVGVTPPPGAPAPAGGTTAGGTTAGGSTTGGTTAGGAARSPGAPVNLNTATAAELDTLPGVGPVLAQRIVDHRTQHGAFTAVSDLRTVEGIGGARYDQLKDLVTV